MLESEGKEVGSKAHSQTDISKTHRVQKKAHSCGLSEDPTTECEE